MDDKPEDRQAANEGARQADEKQQAEEEQRIGREAAEAGAAPTDLARQVDRFVAECIRHRRRELGMNQREFGQRVGVSLQQVHKYERQLNRVSAGRLFVIASVLKVPIQYFFAAAGEAAPQGEATADPAQAQLLHQCAMLRDPAHQRAVASLCRLLTDAERQSGRR